MRDAADGVSRHWWTPAGRKEEIPKLIQPGGSQKRRRWREGESCLLIELAGHLEKWCSKFDTLISKNTSGFIIGNALSIADLALFVSNFSHLYS